MKAALFAKTYGGDAGAALASTFFESIDPLIRNVEHGMFGSLPAVARVEGLVRSGARPASLAIADDIAKAVNMLARLKSNNIPIAEYLGQGAMFERELTPLQEQMLGHLNEIARSPRAVRGFFDSYADAVDTAADLRQGGMFGAAPPTKEDLVARAITASRPVEPAGGLFAEALPAAPRAAAPAPVGIGATHPRPAAPPSRPPPPDSEAPPPPQPPISSPRRVPPLQPPVRDWKNPPQR